MTFYFLNGNLQHRLIFLFLFLGFARFCISLFLFVLRLFRVLRLVCRYRGLGNSVWLRDEECVKTGDGDSASHAYLPSGARSSSVKVQYERKIPSHSYNLGAPPDSAGLGPPPVPEDTLRTVVRWTVRRPGFAAIAVNCFAKNMLRISGIV